MEKIIKGHLVGFRSVRDMEMLEEDYNGEFTDAGMSDIQYPRYNGVPSKDECDRISEELSGKIVIYKTKR
ncbi:hypothetical protein [Oceanobacillus sp. CF4.6]|uniref:hypothetical protein n=1 Tax=Oceanobacillus sp. CF4.6 TaxID=3373080 RepID=UPI003EE596A6